MENNTARRNSLQKKECYASLLALYGQLLTPSIHARMVAFYLEDFSITEISQNEHVSRTAIFQSLNIGDHELDHYEAVLHLYRRNQECLALIEKLSQANDADREKLLGQLKGILENGI
ncbi:MAG: DNA-binding protein [Bacilli bacterium]|jgi:predicted DNA-binding protein YlxM (UPF0122 family)|nr:DNA-binding protein [Bacilli bacterium]